MAENNRDRIIKVAGYAKRVFFNDNIEYRNFSPDLVGLQFTSEGGSALFTMGNFTITTNADPSQYTVFNLGTFSKKYTLEDITDGDDLVISIQKNLTAGLNLDLTNPLSYIWYGSAEEMFRVSLIRIRDYFPAAIYVDNKVGSISGNNITNYSYDPVNDESSFSASTNYFNNSFGIEYTSDYQYKVYEEDIDEYGVVNTDNPLRNFTINHNKYVIEHNGISKNIKSIIAPTVETDTILTIVADGNPFPELTTINFSTYTFLNDKFNGSIPFFIKPNEIEQQKFFTSLNDLEKNILNLDIIPKYTMVINKPVISDDGVIVFIEDKITFPLLEDGYNLNFFDGLYLSYLNQLTEYADGLDKYNTDIILRKYTTDAVSSFDTIPRGDGNDLTLDGERATKLFRIYGREFDEVKKYIDGIKFAHVVTYDKKNNTPDSLVKDLSAMLGLEGFNFLDNFKIKENILPSFGDVTYSGISKTLSNQELDIEIYRRLILNIAWLWKSKGTRKAVEFLFRFIGAPESLVNFNEYIVMVDKPLDMEKIKQLLYIYTGSEQSVNDILENIPYDKNGYPLPPLNGSKVIVDFIDGPDLQSGSGSTSNNPLGQPIFFEDYDLDKNGVIDVNDVTAWVKRKEDGEITETEAFIIVNDLYKMILGDIPLPPNISNNTPMIGNLPGIVVSEERDMWFQKAGGWYRETAGPFATILKLDGNNPHIGASVDSNGLYSTYDGGSEYLSIFSRCYIPNFNGIPKITTSATTLYENNFVNYNYGIFNGIPENSDIYTSFLSLDNQPIDDCVIVTPTIITTPYNPDGVTTIEEAFQQAEVAYTKWVSDINQDPYLKYSPEWEVVKNNYNIAQKNRAQEINTEACSANLTLELCIDKNLKGSVGSDRQDRHGEDDDGSGGGSRWDTKDVNPCDFYIKDKSNSPYIVFRDPTITTTPIVSFNDFSQCCHTAGGTYKQYLAPDGSTGEFCATNSPCAGTRLETREDGIVIFELTKGNVIPDNIYQIHCDCYQLTAKGEEYFSQKKKQEGFMDLAAYVKHINDTHTFPRSFYNYFTKVECGGTRSIVSSPECCAWHNLDYSIDEKTGQVHCIDRDYINDITTTTSGKPLVIEIGKNIRKTTLEINENADKLKNVNLTVVDRKKIQADIIKGNVDKFFLEKEQKKIKYEEQNLIEPQTSKEITEYRFPGNPAGKPELYQTLNVFKQSIGNATILKGAAKSSLSSINSDFTSTFLDPDLMQTKKWEVGKVDPLGRTTFTATDKKGGKHELDWTSAGPLNDLYVKIAKTQGLIFEKFMVDKVNNKLVKKPDKYLRDNSHNNEYTQAAVDPASITCEGIDDVKIIFGSNLYNGFYLPLSPEGNNSIDISFDYMIKYDAETLYDCIGTNQLCGLPAIFNDNSLENIDCLNFAIFIAGEENEATQIRNNLYSAYNNGESPLKTSTVFQQVGIQAEPTVECCEAIGGTLIPLNNWVNANTQWVKQINGKYSQLLNDPTLITSILGTSVDYETQQLIASYIKALLKYRREVNRLKETNCVNFRPFSYSKYCDPNFYLGLITTSNVCSLQVPLKCGLFTKILCDFMSIIEELKYMIHVTDLCDEEIGDIGDIMTEIDTEMVNVHADLTHDNDNTNNEIVDGEVNLTDLDDNLTLVNVEIDNKERDNEAIDVALVDTEPETDCNIYDEQIENLNNFSTNDYCKSESNNRDIKNKKEQINYYNTCVKQKNKELQKEKQTYLKLKQECSVIVSLNSQLVEAKNKNQTNVITSLEYSIKQTKENIDNICSECGSSVVANTSLQLTRQLNTADSVVVNRVAVILNTTVDKITVNDKLELSDGEKIKLRVIQSKNIASLNKKKSEVTDLLNSKSKKEQGIEVLKAEGKRNQQELNKVLNNLMTQKGRLEDPQYVIYSDKTQVDDPTGILNFKYTKCVNACYKNYREGSDEWAKCCSGCSPILKGEEDETEGATVYYRKAQSDNTTPGTPDKDDGPGETDEKLDPHKCCKELLELLQSIKNRIEMSYPIVEDQFHQKQQYGLGNVQFSTRECYEEWKAQILAAYAQYMESITQSYLTYLNNLSLDFNIEVNNCLQGACPLNNVDSNILTTPYGVEDFWNFSFLNDYSGVLIEGNNSQDVIDAIYDEIAGVINLPPGGSISQTLFDPQWQTFNYSLSADVCEILKICYPGKEFFMSIDIENFDCGVCILIDNIKINSNTYIVENITASNDCLIPELTCVIDNKKSWVFTDKGIKVKSTFPDGPCTTGTAETSIVLTTPQNRLWQELEYRYTDYQVNHSDLIINTKSAGISIDPAKSIECDVYNFWREINCDECPTSCVSADTIFYEGVIRETPSASLSGYTLPLSGNPTGISFSCDTYTDILATEVNNLKNKYYTLTANYNESLSATYQDLKEKGGSLSNFIIQNNNCETDTLVIGNYKDTDELFGLLVEGSDGTISFWETYVYNTTTPHAGGERIEIYSGYTAQTFNHTDEMTEECCKNINGLLNDTGKSGMGLGKVYEWNESVNACTWTTLGECNSDCDYFGYKDKNNIETGYISDNFKIWFSAGTTTINVMYESDKPIGAYQMILLNNAGTPILPNLIGVGGGDSGAAGFWGTSNTYQCVQSTLTTTILPPSSGVLVELTFASPITTIFNDYNGEILDRMRIASTNISHNGTGQGADVTGDGNYNILDLVVMVNNLLTTPTLEGVGNGIHGNMSGDDGVENIYGLVWAILTMSAPWNVPPTDSFSNYEDIIGINTVCTVSKVPVCINPLNYLDTPPDKIGAKQVFDEIVLRNLIDAKDRQTISGYPLLGLFYQLYLNANNCGEDLSGKLTYNNLFEFMDKIGDYWLDLIEQVVPATTIWEGCESSGKIYRNTIFDQNKYPYKKYTLNSMQIPQDCVAVSDVTNESIGEAHVDISIMENCAGGDCLGDEYTACMRQQYLINVKLNAIQKKIDFIKLQINAFNSRSPNPTGDDNSILPIVDCQYSQAEIDNLENVEKPELENFKSLIQAELLEKTNECAAISAQITTANALYDSVKNSCSAIATRISNADSKLELLEPNTLQYEKQKEYISVLNNEYRKCMRSADGNISNYNTVFITQIYASNEFEGNVMVFGDDEWDGPSDADGDGVMDNPAGPFYNTELIHNCES